MLNVKVDTHRLYESVAKYVYDSYPEEDITSVYVAESLKPSYRPQIHRMYLTEVAVLYQFGPDGYDSKGYQIPYRSSDADDINTLGSVQMAAFVDKQIQELSPETFDLQPQPIEFEGDADLIDAIISKIEYLETKNFEIIRNE